MTRPARSTSREPRVYVSRLGRHHFSYLRGIAEGLDMHQTAQRYLGIKHGHEAITAHRQVADAVKAVARRHNEKAWRLIGLTVRLTLDPSRPTLEEFATERDLDGWSESDLAEFYADAYPPNKKTDRRQRLREAQLTLIRRMEGLAAETPSETDLVSGWFDDVIAERITAAGMGTLKELNSNISRGGRWYRTIAGIGAGKAKRIESFLATLLAREVQPAKPIFRLDAPPSLVAASLPVQIRPYLGSIQFGDQTAALLNARNDVEAVDAWVNARSGSTATATIYQRESRRLLLWLQYERGGKPLSKVQIGDCSAYLAFLQNIPARWISRSRAAPGALGWAPFRGPLSHKSQQQTVVIVASLFAWLQSAQYINTNPWPLINTKTGDDQTERLLDTKALSESAMSEVLRFVNAQAPSPSSNRILFILKFLESVGLRSSELLAAKLEDIRMEPEGWMLQVHGKGSKNRICVIPPRGLEALQNYLEARHLGSIESAPPSAPLLASTLDPLEPVGYQALYEHVKRWISRAVSASALPANERQKLAGATTHWLRHTFGTRAVAREVPLDVIQAQMGHASIQTTVSIYGRAPINRRSQELAKAFV